ncbi:MAG TPA: XRE family transcriptional regulator [Caulobacteraceae bacterium]|nr:XRE family transcriptional regulator [Caulobacteraceae bacterium]
MRKLRLAKGWTLADLSAESGVPVSTLSRVELGQSMLNYDKLVRLCRALEVDLEGLLAQEASTTHLATGRRSIVRAGEGAPVRILGRIGLAAGADLLAKSFTPIVLTIEGGATPPAALRSTDGEAYLRVLDGAVVLRSELYAPLVLAAGDAIYFDGRASFAIDGGGEGPATALLVIEGDDGVYA